SHQELISQSVTLSRPSICLQAFLYSLISINRCTFINPPSQKSSCQICLSPSPIPIPIPIPIPSSSSSSVTGEVFRWSCRACSFSNPAAAAACEVCGATAALPSLSSASLRASLLSDLEPEPQELAHPDIGRVFLPLLRCDAKRSPPPSTSPETKLGRAATSHKRPRAHEEQQKQQLVMNPPSPALVLLSSRVETLSAGSTLGRAGSLRKPHWISEHEPNVGRSAQFCAARHRLVRSWAVPCCSVSSCTTPGGRITSSSYRTHAPRWFRGAISAPRDYVISGMLHRLWSATSALRWLLAVVTWAKLMLLMPLFTGNVGGNSKRCIIKLLSYNVWFREDLELRRRMQALGDLIEQNSPDFICLQMSKLPLKRFSCIPFTNSVMGRELCLADIDVGGSKKLIVATSHLESPCPAPPRWDQMYSKERVAQANEAINLLKDSPNAIFAGDMNWDDRLDGAFPLPDGWIDAWLELRPGENGWTYDTKANQMLSGNRTLQKRLDRFMCNLHDFKVDGIEMIGVEAIPGLSYCKEKKVRKVFQKLVLPVLPSDHYGLLLTISSL
ncbi:hypothetical protein BHE74_00025621, partial [Ensete ventricosum]